MSTRALVDPELAPVLDLVPPVELAVESLPETRAWFTELLRQVPLGELPETERSEHRVPGPDGQPEVRVLVHRPPDLPTPSPALLWIHGGGFVLGCADEAEGFARVVAATVGCTVVCVDYRLAPETPFPGPVEDCYAALRWLHGDAETLGIDPRRLAVGGDSAGGGLAAGVALLARDRGEVPLVFQLLVYPMLDDRTVTAEPNPYTGEFLWTRTHNAFGWRAYLGGEPGGAGVSPYAAPARAEDLAGLAPAFVCVGALDLFLDEDLDYAHRLLRAGVPTELHVYPGAYHGFVIVPDAAVSQAYNRQVRHALRRALSPGTRSS